MPYLPMDENFADHPKNDVLSDGAFRLHVAGLLFCSRFPAHGYVPASRICHLVPRYRRESLTELLDAGVVKAVEHGFRFTHTPLGDERRAAVERIRATDRRRWSQIVFARDAYRCVQCGAADDLTLDHVVPLLHDDSARTSADDFATLCRPCNSRKGALI